MYLNFFSWNVKNNKERSLYSDLGVHLSVLKTDILILIECFIESPIVELNAFEELSDFVNETGSRTVRVFLNKNSGLMDVKTASSNGNKLRCVRLKSNTGYEFNLAAVHLYSKTGKTELHQFSENLGMKTAINEFELNVKDNTTIIVGDLNYQPFESHLLTPHFFNAINDKALISHLKTRNFQRESYSYYYNPMWNLLGDYDYVRKGAKVSGTYYWDTSDVGQYHWNLLDGVLLSQAMMDKLEIESLKIETEINNKSLLNTHPTGDKKTMLKEGFSDHLPIIFSIKTN
jgi:hypothetical protein